MAHLCVKIPFFIYLTNEGYFGVCGGGGRLILAKIEYFYATIL
jgi:hypothetical protein